MAKTDDDEGHEGKAGGRPTAGPGPIPIPFANTGRARCRGRRPFLPLLTAVRLSWVVQGGKHVRAPKRQEHKGKTTDGPQREPASALGEFPAHHEKPQV